MMGLPNINIEFTTKAANAIKRSSRGIVACIVKDTTEGGDEINTYNSLNSVDFTKYTEQNYEYLKLIFAAFPASVIVVRVDSIETDYTAALKLLKDLKWNYLTIPEIAPDKTAAIVAWIKEQREKSNKTFKAVLPKTIADHEGIINCMVDNVMTSIVNKSVDATAYSARIAGVLAALPLSQSATYHVLEDIISVDLKDDPDTSIDKGELIAVFDGSKYKIARGVNSLTTTTEEKGLEFKKIKIIEGKDLISDDIRDSFENLFIGKVRNSYDKKQEFVANVNNYFRELAGDVLEENFDNVCSIDVEAQQKYLNDNGIDITKMTDVQIVEANTGSHLFIKSNIKMVDAMEDLTMVNYM